MDSTYLTGTWVYRSWNNDTNLASTPDSLVFGNGYIEIAPSPINEFSGLIYGPKNANNPNPFDKPFSWELQLKGSTNFGNPAAVRFQGKGVIDGNEWIYNYIGYVVPPWQNGINEKPAIVGSIVRVVPHPSGSVDSNGQPVIHPAGVVASWYAVKMDEEDC
jgi:hypothetical protein